MKRFVEQDYLLSIEIISQNPICDYFLFIYVLLFQFKLLECLCAIPCVGKNEWVLVYKIGGLLLIC